VPHEYVRGFVHSHAFAIDGDGDLARRGKRESRLSRAPGLAQPAFDAPRVDLAGAAAAQSAAGHDDVVAQIAVEIRHGGVGDLRTHRYEGRQVDERTLGDVINPERPVALFRADELQFAVVS